MCMAPRIGDSLPCRKRIDRQRATGLSTCPLPAMQSRQIALAEAAHVDVGFPTWCGHTVEARVYTLATVGALR